MSVIELKIPDIGGHSDVNVAEVYIKVGDVVKVDDNLLMLETDKATMEVPAEVAGVVTEVLVQVGSKVNEGDVVIKVQAEGAATTTAPVVEPVKEQQSAPANEPVKAAAPTGGSQTVQVTVPDLSGHSNVAIIEIAVKVGDSIKEDDTIMTLETDKATMEVPSTATGIIKELKVAVGGKVSQGDLIMLVETVGGATVAAANTVPASPQASAPVATVATESVAKAAPSAPVAVVDEASFTKAFASPSMRKLARELGVDLGKVKGTGTKGRITENDV